MGASQSRSGCCCSSKIKEEVKYRNSNTTINAYENSRIIDQIPVPRDSFQNYISIIGRGDPDWEPFKALLNRYFGSKQEEESHLFESEITKKLCPEAQQILREQFGGSNFSRLSGYENKIKKNNASVSRPSRLSRPSNLNKTHVDNRPTAAGAGANESFSIYASVNASKCPRELALIVMKEKIKEQIMNIQMKTLVNNFSLKIVEHFNIGGLDSNEEGIVIKRVCQVFKWFMKVIQKNIYSNTAFPAYVSQKSTYRLDLKNIVGGFMYEIMFEQDNLSTKSLIIDHLKEKCQLKVQALRQAILHKEDFALTGNQRIVEQFPEFLEESQYQEVIRMIGDLININDPSVKVDMIKLIVDKILETVKDRLKNNEEACSRLAIGWREPDVRASVIAFCVLESQNTDLLFDFEMIEMFIGEIDQIEEFKASLNLLIEPYKEVDSRS